MPNHVSVDRSCFITQCVLPIIVSIFVEFLNSNLAWSFCFMFWRRHGNKQSGKPSPLTPSDAPQVFIIGGDAVTFQQTRSNFEIIADTEVNKKRVIFDMIATTIKKDGKTLAYDIDRHGRMNIDKPEEVAQGVGGPSVATSEDILRALKILQDTMPKHSHIQEHAEKKADVRNRHYQVALQTEAYDQTQPYYFVTLNYLLTIGITLDSEQQLGLRKALINSHIKSPKQR